MEGQGKGNPRHRRCRVRPLRAAPLPSMLQRHAVLSTASPSTCAGRLLAKSASRHSNQYARAISIRNADCLAQCRRAPSSKKLQDHHNSALRR